MTEFLTSPHLIDVILGLTVLEGIVLFAWRRKRALVVMLLPGMFLMLAIHAALDGAAWPWVPLALLGALLTHLADLRERI